MFSMLKGLAGGANMWFLAGLFAVGLSMGTGAGWKVGSWKADASHVQDWKNVAGDKADSLDLSEENRKKDRQNWLDAVELAKKGDAVTASEANAILKQLGGMSNAISSIQTQTTILAFGSCNFTADFDWLRYSAWLAATGRAAETTNRPGEATGVNGASGIAPDPATTHPD